MGRGRAGLAGEGSLPCGWLGMPEPGESEARGSRQPPRQKAEARRRGKGPCTVYELARLDCDGPQPRYMAAT